MEANPISNLVTKLNGYKMFLGLAVAGLGVVVKFLDQELGQSMIEGGLVLGGVGALHKCAKGCKAEHGGPTP